MSKLPDPDLQGDYRHKMFYLTVTVDYNTKVYADEMYQRAMNELSELCRQLEKKYDHLHLRINKG